MGTSEAGRVALSPGVRNGRTVAARAMVRRMCLTQRTVTEVRRLVGPHACPAVATTCVTRTGQGWAHDRTRHVPAAELANRFVL